MESATETKQTATILLSALEDLCMIRVLARELLAMVPRPTDRMAGADYDRLAKLVAETERNDANAPKSVSK